MTSKKKDPAKKIVPTADELSDAPLDVLMDALAKVSGELQGKQGAELRKHVATVKVQVDTLVQQVQIKQEGEVARKVVAGEVEKLIDAVVKTGSEAGKALARQREPIANAFRGVDLDKMADGLRLFADWLKNPSEDTAAQVKELVEELQRTMGPLVGHDPAREDEERRAAIKKDVQASLDEIFRGKKKPT